MLYGPLWKTPASWKCQWRFVNSDARWYYIFYTAAYDVASKRTHFH